MQLVARLSAFTFGAVVVAASATACSSSTTVTPGPTDSGPVDSGKVTKDASGSTPDAAQDDAATGCSPADVSKWTPPAYVPAGYKAGACTQAQIDALVTACYDQNSTQTTCDAFSKANPTCMACVETKDTDAKWGPLVDFAPGGNDLGLFYNFAGCEELVQKNTTCAQSAEFSLACEMAACNPPTCDLSSGDQSAFDAYFQCLDDASKAPKCKTYEDAQTACRNDDGGAVSTICTADFNNDIAAFKTFIGVFCK